VRAAADSAEERMRQARARRRRSRVAGSVERAAVVERPIVCRGPLYLVHPSVTEACAASLLRIAALLRDESHPVDPTALDALQAFVRDGSSPFFGRDVAAAERELARLRYLVETGQSPRSHPPPRGLRLRAHGSESPAPTAVGLAR
jgi:hypothetical protein